MSLRADRRVAYAVALNDPFGAGLVVRETGLAEAPKPRLLERGRLAIRARHYSRRTEKAYVVQLRGPATRGSRRSPPATDRNVRPHLGEIGFTHEALKAHRMSG